MRLTDVYYGLEADGSYSITMDVFQAVLCVDNRISPAVGSRGLRRHVHAQGGYQGVVVNHVLAHDWERVDMTVGRGWLSRVDRAGG